MFKSNLLSSKECKQPCLLKSQIKKKVTPTHGLENTAQDFLPTESASPQTINENILDYENLTENVSQRRLNGSPEQEC